MPDARQNHLSAIRAAKEELKTAGPHHRRDLMKHIHRMQKELKIYDALHRRAAQKGEPP